MKILSKEEFMQNKEFYLDEIRTGKIFVYPTDTIYGIGCDATDNKGVRKMREIKKREEKMFSVIAPSKEWIAKNCFVDEKASKWLAKLPGAYTFILKLKDIGCIAESVNNNTASLGVRIPDNWFSEIISEFGKPFVTTSVNLSGEGAFMTSLENMNKEIKDKVDYIIYTGELAGKPSTIVKLIDGKEEIIKR